MGKDKIEESSKKWAEMNSNILMNIFAYLSVADVVLNVTGVCRTWLTAAKDYCVTLKTLDLSNARKKPVAMTRYSSMPNIEISMCVRNFSDSTRFRNLTALVFDPSSFINDAHLIYAAQRCPNLKQLALPFLQITEEKLAGAFKLWPKLESLAISLLRDAPPRIVLESIGQNCKVLKSLRLCTRHFVKDTASIITSCLPNLSILSFRAGKIQPEAVLNVMRELKNLEEMYIAHTAVHYGTERSIIFCFLALHQNEEIGVEARRLKRFHICRAACCNDCTNEIIVI